MSYLIILWLYILGVFLTYDRIEKRTSYPSWANAMADIFIPAFWPICVTAILIWKGVDLIYKTYIS